jgi:NAD(P)-dependent dehydrogenase (short-subunit alcohol dehydrogenase family)
LHARGANIVLVGRDLSAVTVLAHELGDRRALPLSVDVTDPAALRNAGIRAVDRFGALYVVFANAGVAPKAPATIAGIDPELFEHTVEVDLLGVWRTVRAALPQVIAHRGHVLVTASIYAYVNGAVNAPYAVSKAAVEQFARALRVELAMHQATAGILYPGWVHTPMSHPAFGGDDFITRMRTAAFPRPLAAAVTPEAVARRVVRGIERRTPSITAPRRWQPVGMLRGLVNPLVDRALIRHRTLQPLLRARENGTQGAGIAAASPAREEGSGRAPCAEGREGCLLPLRRRPTSAEPSAAFATTPVGRSLSIARPLPYEDAGDDRSLRGEGKAQAPVGEEFRLAAKFPPRAERPCSAAHPVDHLVAVDAEASCVGDGFPGARTR